MIFSGISRTFSTAGEQQYETIGAFWDEMSERYGRKNLRGLGYHWTEDSIEYVIGLKDGILPDADCHAELPDHGWNTVLGKTDQLAELYDRIYQDGRLSYEIEMFDDDGRCEIMYCRISET